MNAAARRGAWAIGVVACAAAVAIAVRAPSAPVRPPVSDELAHSLYVELAQAEPAYRLQTSEDYASDPWSRDDAFAALEGGKVVQLRDRHGISVQDVYRAFDEGLRRRWPIPEGAERPRAFVAPLRPRPFD